MGLNVSTAMGFENKDSLYNFESKIMHNVHTNKNDTDSTIFSDAKAIEDTQKTILKASTQISLNKPLKETLKYLRDHAYKKITKKYVLGELWDLYSKSKNNEESYNGELYDFEISTDKVNIFAA